MGIVVFSGKMQRLCAMAAWAAACIYITRSFYLKVCSEKTDKKHDFASAVRDDAVVKLIIIIIPRKYLVKKKLRLKALTRLGKDTYIWKPKSLCSPLLDILTVIKAC